MQVLTTFLFTMATLLLLATAAKATHNGDDGSSPEHLRVLQAQKNKEFKRICGLSFYCQRFTVKRIDPFVLRFIDFHFDTDVPHIVA